MNAQCANNWENYLDIQRENAYYKKKLTMQIATSS
jgi:hypothetical protein